MQFKLPTFLRPILMRPMLAFALLLSATCAPASALADMTNCTTISALPATISVPGHYCLGTSLTTAASSGFAITVLANNVVLDCNENEITYTGIVGLTAIRGNARSDVEVRHCRLINFGRGFDFLSNSRRIWIHDNVVTGAKIAGISASGRDNEISSNLVTDTSGPNGIAVEAIAGSTALVSGNTVRTLNGTATALSGIRVFGAGRVILTNNVVRDVGIPTTTTSVAVKVDSDSALTPSPAVLVEGALFKGAGVRSYAVRALTGTASSVCENVELFGYGATPTPGCL